MPRGERIGRINVKVGRNMDESGSLKIETANDPPISSMMVKSKLPTSGAASIERPAVELPIFKLNHANHKLSDGN